MEALLSNAADASEALGLTLGDPLSDAQKAALKQDIVWYERATVNGQTVLVPKLYLAAGEAALSGASIGGRNVSLSGASVNNSGQISAQDRLSIVARTGDITNTGSLGGGSVQLVSQNGSIINSDTLNDYAVEGGNQQQLASVGTITSKGAATLVAGKDITFDGGVLAGGGDVTAIAGRDLTLGTKEVRQAATAQRGGATFADSQTQNYTSVVSAGKDMTLAALGGDLSAAGATLLSGGDALLSAGQSLSLSGVTDSQSHSVAGKKSGFLTHSAFEDSSANSVETGTTVASNGSLTLASGGDMTLKGLFGAGGDVVASAGGALSIDATQSMSNTTHRYEKSGFAFGGNGATATAGYSSRKSDSEVRNTTWSPSVVASTGGKVTLASGGALSLDASVASAAGDLTLSGSSVPFGTHDTVVSSAGMEFRKSIGLQVGVDPSSSAGQLINVVLAASQSGDATLGALYGVQGAFLSSQAVSKALTGKFADRTQNNLIDVQYGFGYESSRQSAEGETHMVQGSSATAGKTLSILARGDNSTDVSNGSLHATAAQLSGHDVILGASKDITLEAGYDTTSQKSASQSIQAFLGDVVSIGRAGTPTYGARASFGMQNSKTASSSSTAVDTQVHGSNSVVIVTPGKATLAGAEVSGDAIMARVGDLEITSSQNRSSYRQSGYQAGLSVTIAPTLAGSSVGGSGGYQNVKNDYFSTGKSLSGLYAGDGGLDVAVDGTTTLNAGVLSSTADAQKNRFVTDKLVANDLTNREHTRGMSASAAVSVGLGGKGNGKGGTPGADGKATPTGSAPLVGQAPPPTPVRQRPTVPWAFGLRPDPRRWDRRLCDGQGARDAKPVCDQREHRRAGDQHVRALQPGRGERERRVR